MNQTVSMHSAKILLMAAIGAAICTGCDKIGAGESPTKLADRKVDEKLAKVQTDRSRKSVDTAGTAASILTGLNAASGESAAGLANKIRAKVELAQEQSHRAIANLKEVELKSFELDRALWDLQKAGEQIRSTQRSSKSISNYEPKEQLAKAAQDSAEIAKSIEAAKGKIAAAQAELDKRQAEINSLKDERKKLEVEGDKLADESNGKKGEEGLKIFAAATDARIKAGTIGAQVEVNTAALMPFTQDLAIAQDQLKFWDSADTKGIKQELDDHKQKIDSSWQDNQNRIKGMNDTAKAIYDKVIKPGGSEKDLNAGAKLVAIVKESEQKRDEVLKLLGESAANYGLATDLAKKLQSDLSAQIATYKSSGTAGEKPEAIAANSMKSLYAESQYALQQGSVKSIIGDVQAGVVVDARKRKATMDELDVVLKASGLELPAEFAVTDLDKSLDTAVNAFKEAEIILSPISELTTLSDSLSSVKSGALASLMHAQYARYQIKPDSELKQQINLNMQRVSEAKISVPALYKKLD